MIRKHSFCGAAVRATNAQPTVQPVPDATSRKSNSWICPDDRELVMQARMQKGWSTRSNSHTSLLPATTGKDAMFQVQRAAVPEVEWRAIRSALQTAEEFDHVERRRIGRLVEQIVQLKLACKLYNSRFVCSFCGTTSFLPFCSPKLGSCIGCLKTVCSNCLVHVNLRRNKKVLLCRLCYKLTEIWKKSGAWYYKKLPDYVPVDEQTLQRLTPLLQQIRFNGSLSHDRSMVCGEESELSSSESTDTEGEDVSQRKSTLAVIKSGVLRLPTRGGHAASTNTDGSTNERKRRDALHDNHTAKADMVLVGYGTNKGQPFDRGTTRTSTLPSRLSRHMNVDTRVHRQVTPDLQDQLCPSLPFTSPHVDTRAVSPQFTSELTSHKRSNSVKSLAFLSTKIDVNRQLSAPAGLRVDMAAESSGEYETDEESDLDELVAEYWSSKNMCMVEDDNVTKTPEFGYITFSLLYNAEKSCLSVTIIKCENLKAMDVSGSSDPFVRLQLLPGLAKGNEHRTSVKKKNLNPQFDETFEYYGLVHHDVPFMKLRLSVFDHDKLTANDLIGEIIFRLQDIQSDVPVTYVRALEQNAVIRRDSLFPVGSPSLCGKLLVSLRYIKEDQLLVVGIVRAASLPAMDTWTQSSDPYVKCYLRPDPLKKTKRKTAVHRRTLNPEFKEQFAYNVEYSQLSSRTLEITVWDYDIMSNNDFIGCVILGNGQSGSEMQQWLDTLCSPDQTFTVWHNLRAFQPSRRNSLAAHDSGI